jgi:hypothetical protein
MIMPIRTLLLTIFFAVPSIAQTSSPNVACALNKGIYTCDKASFVKSLNAAKTVAVESQGTDHISPPQLKGLVKSLGKTSQPAPADLTFLLIPSTGDGVNVGPAGSELATLRVYAPAPAGQRGDLLWIESYTGQADMTWPAVVHALIQQFQTKFK